MAGMTHLHCIAHAGICTLQSYHPDIAYKPLMVDQVALIYVKQPSCIQAWNIQYDIQFDECEWKKLFVLPWKLTKDHKLIEFQYKILHKVFASQSYVSRC